MNLTVVLATTAVERGGVWRHMLDLAEMLRAGGDRVVLAVPADAVALRDDATRKSFSCTGLDRSPRTAADVWHLHLPKPFDRRTLPLLSTARLRGRRTFVTEHLPRHPSSDSTLAWDPRIPPGRRKPGAYAGKTALKQAESRVAHQVITVSQSSRQFMMDRFGLDAGRCSSVANGVRGSEFVPLPSFANGLRAIAVGTAGVRKGHDLIIEAALRSEQVWTMDVFGDGPELAEMRQRAEATRGRVTFHGWTDQVDQHIDSHHLMCMPSRHEALPYGAVEAMGRGRPVIAAAVDGLTEVVVPDVTGRLVPPNDAGALAAALDFAALHPAVVTAWAVAAHDRARTKFDVARMAATIRDIYLGKRSAR
jgi:glycosyltransferase involved in cell wall biosynthesis